MKQTTPTPTSPTAFGYRVSQVDGAQIQPGVTQINDSITVPPNPNTATINNLLISPDYVVNETTLPPAGPSSRSSAPRLTRSPASQ